MDCSIWSVTEPGTAPPPSTDTVLAMREVLMVASSRWRACSSVSPGLPSTTPSPCPVTAGSQGGNSANRATGGGEVPAGTPLPALAGGGALRGRRVFFLSAGSSIPLGMTGTSICCRATRSCDPSATGTIVAGEASAWSPPLVEPGPRRRHQPIWSSTCMSFFTAISLSRRAVALSRMASGRFSTGVSGENSPVIISSIPTFPRPRVRR